MKHDNSCERVFKNYDLKCSRCIQLAAGAAPREGWQKSYYATKKRQDEVTRYELANHSCTNADGSRRCNIVCTFGEW